MLSVDISDFSANLLEYLEQANAGAEISITINGKPIATIRPPVNQKEQARQQLERLAKTAKAIDILSSAETKWYACE